MMIRTFSSIGDFVDNSPAYKLICTSMRELLPNKKELVWICSLPMRWGGVGSNIVGLCGEYGCISRSNL